MRLHLNKLSWIKPELFEFEFDFFASRFRKKQERLKA